METRVAYADPVEYANQRGVRYPDDCRCAGCPWHYDCEAICDCNENPTIGSLCPKHSRYAGLRVGPSSIAGRGLFAQYRTEEPYAGSPRVVFKKGAIVGYYGGIYRTGPDSSASRNFYGAQVDRYMLTVPEYKGMRDDYPPHKAQYVHLGPTRNRYFRSKAREYEEEEEEEKRAYWDIDASESTTSMLRYANDPLNTAYKANVKFEDAYVELDDVQFQRFIEGKHFFVGDAKILFPRESINIFLALRSVYVSEDHEEGVLSRFAIPCSVIVAKRDIFEGEEILVSYGDGYWAKVKEGDESESESEASLYEEEEEEEGGAMLFSRNDMSDDDDEEDAVTSSDE